MLLLLLIVLLPELWAIVLSLMDYRLGQPIRFIGFGNYGRILSDGQFWSSVYRNLLFTVAAVGSQMLLGLAIALLLATTFNMQRLWVSLILAPMAASPAVAAVTWKYLLNFNIGPINYLLESIGGERLQWLADPTLAMVSVILVYVWHSTPHVVLMLYPARMTFPTPLYEAARIDGAGRWKSFLYITLPLLRPALYVALVFRIMISFRVFGWVWTLTQGGPVGATEILPIYLYRQGFRYWRFGTAAAVAFIMLVLTLILASYQIRSMYKRMFQADYK
jgi:ABC-type sugar transport system permease subunit